MKQTTVGSKKISRVVPPINDKAYSGNKLTIRLDKKLPDAGIYELLGCTHFKKFHNTYVKGCHAIRKNFIRTLQNVYDYKTIEKEEYTKYIFNITK
jgi:hypothetical protein